MRPAESLHAAARGPVTVTLPDGRTVDGFLHYWPSDGITSRSGRKARVVTLAGAWLSVPPESVTIEGVA
jgi:hypothetical protein